MATLVQKFLIRARRSGLPMPVLALGPVALLAVSAVLSGIDGVLLTIAIATAFLLGTATREGPFHLRSLATMPVAQVVNSATLLARMGAADEQPKPAGQALCYVLQLDGYEDLPARLGQRGVQTIARQMQERLYGDLRHNDTLADLGGGKYAVYLPASPRIDLESAVQTALRLQTVTMQPVSVDGLRLHLTSSIGFCISARLPEGADTPALLNAAETALQVALCDAPRAVRAYDHTMQRNTAPKPVQTAAQDLAGALENSEILPWYQPQICTDTGILTGIEALARWQDADGTVRTPGQFLGELQAKGLSQKLTDTMINAALAQMCTWDRAGLHVPRISVNLGAEDLADPSLANRIGWALERHALPAARLGLEVLETVVADADPDAMAGRNLLALGALGCRIDLDDFGTGSASINGIRRFGVHRIKIDRSLVTAVDTDRDQHAMFAAILTMAQQLGVEVLAEGVETPGEFSALAQLGCAHVQGFAIARPMPAANLAAWMLRRGEGQMSEFRGGLIVKAAELPRRDAPSGRMGGKTA